MSSNPRLPLLLVALLVPSALAAQSPTLPSDTLEANFAPRSVPGPAPELAPTLPSDTLDVVAPDDSTDGGMRRDWDQNEGRWEPHRQDEEL